MPAVSFQAAVTKGMPKLYGRLDLMGLPRLPRGFPVGRTCAVNSHDFWGIDQIRVAREAARPGPAT